MNHKARLAWELYLKMETSGESFSLLQLVANDCYKVMHNAFLWHTLGYLTCHWHFPIYTLALGLVCTLRNTSASWNQYIFVSLILRSGPKGWGIGELALGCYAHHPTPFGHYAGYVSLQPNALFVLFRWVSSTMQLKLSTCWKDWTLTLNIGKESEAHAWEYSSKSLQATNQGMESELICSFVENDSETGCTRYGTNF